MALRIPWDKQETAILIDAYLRVRNKELSQKDAVKEVSTLLRRRAILSGIEIDDIFRNVNGITMQMKIIGGLVDDRPSGLHSATKMFTDMVTLYKNNPVAFDEILIQAKGECAMQVNVQERFFAWLSARVSPAQLSEFYIVCKDIESFCMSKRILTESLFETTSTVVIQGVIDTIKSNRMFQFKYFRQLGKMRKVMDYYMAFLREVPLQQVKEPEIVHATREENRAFSEEHSAPQNLVSSDTNHEREPVQSDIKELVYEADNIPIEGKTDSIEVADSEDSGKGENSSEDASIWNFANDNLDFSNMIPVTVSYFGDEVKVQGWADAFVKIICSMQEDYPSIIRGMVGYRFSSVGKVALTGMAGLGRLSRAAELNNGLYLETDCSPDEIVTIVRVLMDKCNMDYDNLEMSYKKFRNTRSDIESQGEKTQTESDEEIIEESTDTNDSKIVITSVSEGKAAFENWLTTGAGLAVRSAQSYTSAINVAGQYSVRLGFSRKELFFILDADQVYQISMKLLANPEFAQMNDSQHNRYRAALSKYWDYCKSISGRATISTPIESVSEQEDEVKKNRTAFIAWAQSQQMQKAAILAYLSDIKKCSEFAQENAYIKEKHILLIEDADVLERVFLEMRKDSKFVELNNERQKRPVSAMNKLIAFRRATAKDGARAVTASAPTAPVEKSAQKAQYQQMRVDVANKPKVYVLDWNIQAAYTGSIPVSYRYKTKKTRQITSWYDIYVQLITDLVAEYPKKIKHGVSVGGRRSFDVSDATKKHNMRRPKNIGNGLVLETFGTPAILIDRMYSYVF